LTLAFLGSYIILVHFFYLPGIEEMYRVTEHNTLFKDKLAMPAFDVPLLIITNLVWFLSPLSCVFLLMFLLSFAKRFFNDHNVVTEFCSKHSINVYILHYIPVLLFQYLLQNVGFAPILKIILMVVIIIPGCLWLSHRLIVPYPKTAIAFFVALKLAALAAGFEFYFRALLFLSAFTFVAALYEFTKFMLSKKPA